MMLFEALWFFLPAGISNMAPLIANKLPGLNQWDTPIDFKQSIRGQRIFGDNKTWRGLLFGSLCAGLTSLGQYYVYMPYVETPLAAFALGLLLGFGALFGDAVASFFKRRHGVAAGESWIPFDQVDYIIGGLLFSYPLVKEFLVVDVLFIIFFSYAVLHLLTSYFGYRIGLKSRPI